MSSLLSNQLPRFDSGEVKSPISLATAFARDFQADGHDDVVTIAEAAPAEEEQPRAQTEEVPPRSETGVEDDSLSVEMAPDPVAIAQADLAARSTQLDGAIASLSDTIATIEADAQARVSAEIQNIATQLFPSFGKAFLADEVSQHLIKLVPPMVASVDVTASAGMAQQLKGKLALPEGHPATIKITTSDSVGPLQIKLSWRSGGFDYNFDDLMTACLAHINSEQTSVEE